MQFLTKEIKDGILVIFEEEAGYFTFTGCYDLKTTPDIKEEAYGIYVNSYSDVLALLYSLFHLSSLFSDSKRSKTLSNCSKPTPKMKCNNLIGRAYLMPAREQFYLAVSCVVKEELLTEYVTAIQNNLFNGLPSYAKTVAPYELVENDLLIFSPTTSIVGLRSTALSGNTDYCNSNKDSDESNTYLMYHAMGLF